MATIDILRDRLRPQRLAQDVGIAHDNARVRYTLDANTVSTFAEYYDRIGDYYSYHYSCCIAHGGQLSRADAVQEARRIVEHEYRNKGGIEAAYIDARDGTNGGVRIQFDAIAQALQAQAINRYVAHVFDTLVAPVAWDDRVELIRQFINKCGADLSQDMRLDTPERYAHDYRNLIQIYVENIGRSASALRAL